LVVSFLYREFWDGKSENGRSGDLENDLEQYWQMRGSECFGMLLCESHALEDSPTHLLQDGVYRMLCHVFFRHSWHEPHRACRIGKQRTTRSAFGATAQLAAENRIPSFKIGGSVRFDRNALEGLKRHYSPVVRFGYSGTVTYFAPEALQVRRTAVVLTSELPKITGSSPDQSLQARL
jgi:hypothetical protein